MSEGTKTRPSRGGNVMLDTVEGVAGGVARFGYGLLDMGLGLLPSQSRQHMRNAIRELSYAFASLPADFAEIAGVEIERWASVSDEAAPSATVAATATVATPAPATGSAAAATPAPVARSAAATGSATTPAAGKAAPAPGSAPATGKAAPAPGSAPATGKAAPAPGSAPATGKAAAPAASSAPTGGAAPAAGKTAAPAASSAPTGGAAPAAGKTAAPAASSAPTGGAAPAAGKAAPAPGSAPATGSAAAASDSASAPVTRISSAAAAASASSTGVTIAHIEFDPPGRDVEGEYVLIRNDSSAPVSLTSWQLEDGQARHTYVFPTCMLAPGAELKLWTRAGVNDGANLYWGQRVAVWNNEGDTCTLLDATGAVVSRFSYTGKKGPTA